MHFHHSLRRHILHPPIMRHQRLPRPLHIANHRSPMQQLPMPNKHIARPPHKRLPLRARCVNKLLQILPSRRHLRLTRINPAMSKPVRLPFM